MKERGRMEYGEGYGARLWCEGCARHARSPMAEVAMRAVGGCEDTQRRHRRALLARSPGSPLHREYRTHSSAQVIMCVGRVV